MPNPRFKQFISGPGWPGGALAGQMDAIISNLDGLGSKTCQVNDFNNISEGLAAQLDAIISNVNGLGPKNTKSKILTFYISLEQFPIHYFILEQFPNTFFHFETVSNTYLHF